MNTAQAVLAILGGLFLLASVGGGLYAQFRSAAQDARIKRLKDEVDDYLSRLNYIEPRHRAMEQQNEILLALHNPTEQLEKLGENDAEILRILNAQHRLMEQIDGRLYAPPRQEGPRDH